MATKWKCHFPDGEFGASTKYAEDAAAIVALWGAGATVKWDHRLVVWTEGKEEISAAESYDRATAIMMARRAKYEREAEERRQAQLAQLRAEMAATKTEIFVETLPSGRMRIVEG